MDRFVFPRSFYDTIKTFSPPHRDKLYSAIFAYMFDSTEVQFTQVELCRVWTLIQPYLDKVRKISITKLGQSRDNVGTMSGQCSFKDKGYKDKEIKEKESKEKEKSPVGDRSGKPQASPSPVVRFIPPTLEEVKAYVQEKGFHFDPEAFFAFYASKGWKIGNTPMKSWRMACVTWEKREPEPEPEAPKPKPIPKVSQCPQCGGYDLKTSYNRLMCRGCGAIYDYSHAKGKWERV